MSSDANSRSIAWRDALPDLGERIRSRTSAKNPNTISRSASFPGMPRLWR